MGDWHAWADRKETASWDRVQRVSAAYRAEHGTRYFDAMAALRDPELWNLPAVRPYAVGTSVEDRQWLDLGLPPRSLVGSDAIHLNALGNTVVAHGLHRFLVGTAGLYPAGTN